MMIDMPAVDMSQTVSNFSWSDIGSAVTDYGPVIDIIKHTWSRESLLEILQGHIAVPDSVINEALEKRLKDSQQDGEGNVKSLSITSKSNGRMEIHADTKSIGRIELSGEIRSFVHNENESYMSYKVKERALKDHGLMSWFFSRISLSMTEKLFGKIEMPENLPTKISGNTITVDFHNLLEGSDLGTHEFMGYRLINMIEIKEAVPKDGYVDFKTEFNVPDTVKEALKNILLKG